MKTETMTPSYREGVADLRGNLAKMIPADVLGGFDGYADELQMAMNGIVKLNVGDTAPDFTLSNQLGNAVSLGDVLKSHHVILVFYRGAWCPYCNLQLGQLQSMLAEFKKANATLLAVSPQTPDASLSFAEKSKLDFQVLSDVGNVVARKYTAVFKHRSEVNQMLGKLGIDFADYYGDDSNEIPVPAVFVIGKNGVVRLARSEGGDFRKRVEVTDILAALR